MNTSIRVLLSFILPVSIIVAFSQPLYAGDVVLSPTRTCDIAGIIAANISESSGELDISSIEDENVRAYFSLVEDIAYSLASYSDFSSSNLKLHFLRSEKVNAFALPCGHIFLEFGLVKFILDNYGNGKKGFSLIAAVIAHELGHVVLRHGDRNLRELLSDRDVSVSALERIEYTRQAEFEADTYGAFILAAAGFEATDMVTLFADMRAEFGDDFRLELIMPADHPSFTARIEALQPMVSEVNQAYQSYNLAVTLLAAERYMEAIDMLQMAARIYEKSPGIYNALAAAYYGLALEAGAIYEAGDLPLKVSFLHFDRPVENIISRSRKGVTRGGNEMMKYLNLAKSALATANQLDPDNPIVISNYIAIHVGLIYLSFGNYDAEGKTQAMADIEEYRQMLYSLPDYLREDMQKAAVLNNLMILEYAAFMMKEDGGSEEMGKMIEAVFKIAGQVPDPVISWNVCAIGLDSIAATEEEGIDEDSEDYEDFKGFKKAVHAVCAEAVAFQCWDENSTNLKLITDRDPELGEAIKDILKKEFVNRPSLCREEIGKAEVILGGFVEEMKDTLRASGIAPDSLKSSLKAKELAEIIVDSGKPDEIINIDKSTLAMIYVDLGFVVYVLKEGEDFIPFALELFNTEFSLDFDGKKLKINDPIERVYRLIGEPESVLTIGSNKFLIYDSGEGMVGLKTEKGLIVSFMFYIEEIG